jgi:gag-polyprotein putative aspartyl protease
MQADDAPAVTGLLPPPHEAAFGRPMQPSTGWTVRKIRTLLKTGVAGTALIQTFLVAGALLAYGERAQALELSCPEPNVIQGGVGKVRISELHIRYDQPSRFWSVRYSYQNGVIVDRNVQYDLADQSDAENIQWIGSLRRDPTLVMTGLIGIDQQTGRFSYLEVLFDTKKGAKPEPQATVKMISKDCMRIDTPEARVVDGFAVPIVSDGGRAIVKVRLGGIEPQPMVVDTGADSIVVSEKVANDLIAHDEANELSPIKALVADGRVVDQRMIRIHRLAIGTHYLANVDAGVGGMMLLGFPILNRFGKFTIDTNASQIIFGEMLAAGDRTPFSLY